MADDEFPRLPKLFITTYLHFTISEFPKSPSALKKLLMYDLPVETSYDPTSDTENDKSIYEAHLSSNLQNVSLTMNEKEGRL